MLQLISQSRPGHKWDSLVIHLEVLFLELYHVSSLLLFGQVFFFLFALVCVCVCVCVEGGGGVMLCLLDKF